MDSIQLDRALDVGIPLFRETSPVLQCFHISLGLRARLECHGPHGCRIPPTFGPGHARPESPYLEAEASGLRQRGATKAGRSGKEADQHGTEKVLYQ